MHANSPDLTVKQLAYSSDELRCWSLPHLYSHAPLMPFPPPCVHWMLYIWRHVNTCVIKDSQLHLPVMTFE